MKYIFFGTPRFASIVLEGLIDAGISPIALVCNPDRPVGRKKIITSPLTKELVTRRDKNISVFQPEKFDDAFTQTLKDLQPDFFVVAAYAKIIPKRILDVPRLGTLGVHPSLLPKYRGSSPIQSVILAGEEKTGVAIYQMDEAMDRGAVFIEESIPLDSLSTDYPTLEEHLAKLGAVLTAKIIPAFFEGKGKPTPQEESHATFTKKFITDDGFVDEKQLDAAIAGNKSFAEAILRKINALTPEPGVWTKKNGVRIKLLKATLHDGSLALLTIQKEGEKPTAFRYF